ncbi:MAG TPA: DUF2283 domain-containing protein [Pseudolabrys sp.]|nr:DUF2283 domain-containing protein [Pseudolabrys sp.]
MPPPAPPAQGRGRHLPRCAGEEPKPRHEAARSPETDSLYIELKSAPGAETREIKGLVVDFGVKGDMVWLDIDHASRKLDLSRIETIALPAVHAAE